MGPAFEVIVVGDPGAATAISESLSQADERLAAEAVPSASDALDRLAKREYDAVVSEYRLPDGDGLSLLESIREDQSSKLPFVMFTSESSEDVAISALNCGVDRYLRKRDGLESQVAELADAVRTEVEQYHAEKRYRLLGDIIEQLDDPVMFQNLDGEFEIVNEAVADYADMSKSDLIGTDEYAFMDENAAETIESSKKRVVEEETALQYEIRPAFPERDERWFSTLRYPHYDENGRVDGTIAICRDVSELKETERELRQKRDRLEEFAGFVSHDLRNPLSVASGRLELARDDCDSPYLEEIDVELERMDDLITDLLSLAQQGAVVSEIEPVQLQEIVTQCWNSVETRNADLVVDETQTVRADPKRLTTLLENLFRNADQHGGTHVTVTVGGLGDGFYIADDGVGIPTDDRETVFETGYSTEHDGTGFGLVIVRQIVEAHDWEIRITDSESGGTRFEITGVDVVSSDSARAETSD